MIKTANYYCSCICYIDGVCYIGGVVVVPQGFNDGVVGWVIVICIYFLILFVNELPLF